MATPVIFGQVDLQGADLAEERGLVYAEFLGRRETVPAGTLQRRADGLRIEHAETGLREIVIYE